MTIVTKFTLDSDADQWTLTPPPASAGTLSNETVDMSKIQEGTGSQKLSAINSLAQYTVNKALSNRNWSDLDMKMEAFIPAAGNIDATKGIQVILTDGNAKFSIYVWDSSSTPALTTDWNTINIADVSDASDPAVAIRSAEFDPSDIVDILWSYQMKSSGVMNDWYADHVRFEADVFPTAGGGPEGGVFDEDGYAAAGLRYAATNINLNVVIEKPIKLDRLFDEMGSEARSRSYWGRGGHNIIYIEDADQVLLSGTSLRTYTEDEEGVTEVDWKNVSSALDIRNTITSLFDRDWVRTASRNESYAGSLTSEDTVSTGTYGLIANEVQGTDKSFFYDFVTTTGHASQLNELYLDFHSQPKKVFTIKGDWRNLDLEPEDIITVSGEELRAPVVCRVDAIKLDNNSFATITTKQV